VTLGNESQWKIQGEWSNLAYDTNIGCVPTGVVSYSLSDRLRVDIVALVRFHVGLHTCDGRRWRGVSVWAADGTIDGAS
jgi:hypothetical protein